MSLTTVHWQIIVSFLGVSVQLFIAHFSRRQIAKQSKDTLDVQRLVSHRATASFVADKRQKWIDELRTDMAFHLALSQEIIWKWDGMRSRVAERVLEESRGDLSKKLKIMQDAADAFSPENGARDREHQERHIRIKFRLNPKEKIHIELRQCLDKIRKVLSKTQASRNKDEANALIKEMIDLVEDGSRLTEEVLKAEWSRVKQEVAYPEALMATIPDPSIK